MADREDAGNDREGKGEGEGGFKGVVLALPALLLLFVPFAAHALALAPALAVVFVPSLSVLSPPATLSVMMLLLLVVTPTSDRLEARERVTVTLSIMIFSKAQSS